MLIDDVNVGAGVGREAGLGGVEVGVATGSDLVGFVDAATGFAGFLTDGSLDDATVSAHDRAGEEVVVDALMAGVGSLVGFDSILDALDDDCDINDDIGN